MEAVWREAEGWVYGWVYMGPGCLTEAGVASPVKARAGSSPGASPSLLSPPSPPSLLAAPANIYLSPPPARHHTGQQLRVYAFGKRLKKTKSLLTLNLPIHWTSHKYWDFSQRGKWWTQTRGSRSICTRLNPIPPNIDSPAEEFVTCLISVMWESWMALPSPCISVTSLGGQLHQFASISSQIAQIQIIDIFMLEIYLLNCLQNWASA